MHLACLRCLEEWKSAKYCAWPPTFYVEIGGQAHFFCAWPLMDPLNIMLGSSMNGQAKFCCSGSHGTSKLCAQRLHERLNTRFLCSTSNFWCQNLEAKQKHLSSTSHGIPELHAQGLHKRLSSKCFYSTSNFWCRKLEVEQKKFNLTSKDLMELVNFTLEGSIRGWT